MSGSGGRRSPTGSRLGARRRGAASRPADDSGRANGRPPKKREVAENGRSQRGRQAGSSSSIASAQAPHKGLGAAFQDVRGVLRRVPRAAWVCALVACLNAVGWSIVSPAFQVPDEPDHFAYVKQLAETGRLPSSSSEQISSEEVAVLEGLHNFQVRQQPQNRTIATQSEQSELQRILTLVAAGRKAGRPAAGVAAAQPPLYYALEAVPFVLAGGGSMLDQLQLMRLTSALLAGLTALFVFLFVREALPATPWAWTVGGLAVALAPLLALMSGAVNPDALLFAVSAAIFYFLARAFRRGLDIAGAATLGALGAVGLLTKLNFLGLLPGLLLGLTVLCLRARRRPDAPSAIRLLGLSWGIALSPIVLLVLFNLLSGRAPLGLVSSAIGHGHGSLLAAVDYIWQLYLPPIPGTAHYFPGIFTARQLWFDGWVGRYGWLDTPFPGWVESLALVPAAAIVLLCGRSLALARGALRSRAGELAVYAVMGLGLMALIGADSYKAFPATDAEFAQARYLLPLLPLLGAALALAARGAGRRWGPIAGTLIVVLFLAHDIFSQLQVVARYYG